MSGWVLFVGYGVVLVAAFFGGHYHGSIDRSIQRMKADDWREIARGWEASYEKALLLLDEERAARVLPPPPTLPGTVGGEGA